MSDTIAAARPTPALAAERVLRWAVVEFGTAGVADRISDRTIAPSPPAWVTPSDAAVAGPVVLLERDPERRPGVSSFGIMRDAVEPGVVVLVACARQIGAAFGSNVALEAALGRAQALLTDGACRDATRLATLGLVIGANATDPTRPLGHPLRPIDEVEMFGLRWRPGDWLLRDRDGIVQLPASALAAASDLLRALADDESTVFLGPA